ncbi:MAG: hypothetical protein OXI96_04280, partial [Acidimicrobiaceae bacterium]|nr:hypothetical protein [Acidimicrobiaceae bacterium]
PPQPDTPFGPPDTPTAIQPLAYEQTGWARSCLATKTQCVRVVGVSAILFLITAYLIYSGRGVWLFTDSNIILNYTVFFAFLTFTLIALGRLTVLAIGNKRTHN